MVLTSGFVQFTVVNAHSSSSDCASRDQLIVLIFHHHYPLVLGHNRGWAYPLTIRDRMDNADLKQFQNFFLDHLFYFRIQPSLVFN